MKLIKKIDHDFQTPKKIVSPSYRNFCSCKTRDKHQKWLRKSQNKIQKELDILKFFYRQRITMTSLLGLLSGRQKFFVDKISQPLIRESSNFEVTSSDEELDKQFNDPFYNTGDKFWQFVC